MSQAATKKKKRLGREELTLNLMILPGLIILIIFVFAPLVGSLMAFENYVPAKGLLKSKWVGLSNFEFIFSLPDSKQVFMNTLIIAFSKLVVNIFVPVTFAILLNEIKCKKFKTFVQTFTTLPNFISWVLVYSVAFALFSSTGMVNSLLENLGVITEPLKFLDSDSHTYLWMLLWNTWKGLGWGAIIYLASIAGIDQELYEAASIDGANRFQLMKNITLPALLPTFFIMLMLAISNFLNNGLDQYFVFQNSFNKEHIQVLDLYVYNIGMTGSSYSLATAISMLKSIISVALLSVCNFVSKKTRGESMI